MADPLSAAKMAGVLKAEGVKVREYKSWRIHNRNHKGTWGPVHGVMQHHTVTSGTAGTVDLCYNGRSDLPGPLCEGVIAKDGEVILVGHGRTNHAGLGDDDVLRAVVDENYGSAPPSPNERTTDGNARFYGFEAINLGNGRDPWPAAQYDAMVRVSAAICRAHGWSAKSVIAHKEWTNQKIDPTLDMAKFRRDVAARLARAASWNPSPPTDGDPVTQLVKGDVSVIFKTDNVLKSPDHLLPEITNKYWTAESYAYETYRVAREARDVATANGVKLDELALIELTDAQVQAIAAAVAAHPGLVEAMAEAVAVKIAGRLAE